MTTQLTDAVGTAHAIRDGEVSAREVVEAAIARIEKHDPDLNAVVGRRFDAALAEVQAGLPDGPLCGVPIVIKDLGANVAGLPSTQGSRLFADHVAAEDSELVARYRRAGLVVLGTTNTPELGLNANTEPVLHGSTRNPWASTHSPGGSSGGSAAAVAAGMVPVAHGSDGGGSIRIPAAMCGLFGLKPSRGRVPAKPYTSFLTSPLSVHHALTTTVRDSALLLDIAAGHTYGDAYGAPGPDRPYVEQVGLPPGPLRIGWTVDTANDTVSTDPQCAAAVERMVALCADLGHELVPLPLDVDAGAVAATNGTLMAASLATTVDRRLAELGRELRDEDVEPFTHVLLDHGRSLTAAQLMEALRVAQETGWRRRRVGQRLDRAGAASGRHAGARVDMVDADRESRSVGVGVVSDHLRKPERRTPLGGHRRADDARGVPDDERHLLLGRQLRRDDEITLVLPVGRVDDHHHPPGGQRRERTLNLLGRRTTRLPHEVISSRLPTRRRPP
jgi:amidase